MTGFRLNVRSVFTMQITKQMMIGECIMKYPDTAEYLFEQGFMCVGCAAANFETLEEGLKVHGKSDKEIDNIVKELNKLIKND